MDVNVKRVEVGEVFDSALQTIVRTDGGCCLLDRQRLPVAVQKWQPTNRFDLAIDQSPKTDLSLPPRTCKMVLLSVSELKPADFGCSLIAGRLCFLKRRQRYYPSCPSLYLAHHGSPLGALVSQPLMNECRVSSRYKPATVPWSSNCRVVSSTRWPVYWRFMRVATELLGTVAKAQRRSELRVGPKRQSRTV
jgi:hypothetical protein